MRDLSCLPSLLVPLLVLVLSPPVSVIPNVHLPVGAWRVRPCLA